MFPLERIDLGPQAYGRRPSTVGVILHTTEYPDSSRRSTDACIRDQSPGGSLYAGGGSYTFIVDDEGPTLTVPYLEIAGGLTRKRTNPPWDPEPWLSKLLPADAFADPNAHHLQIAVSGRTAALMGYPGVVGLAEDCARIIRWAELQPWAADDLLTSGHLHWQSNRSDPGQAFVDAVMAAYRDIVADYPAPPVAPALTDWAGRLSAFGTPYPEYIHTDAQALAWVNRNIARLRAAGKL